MDYVQLNICKAMVNNSPPPVIGMPEDEPCCSLLGQLGIEVSTCLCVAFQAQIFGASFDIPVRINLLLGSCGISFSGGLDCT